MPELNLDLIKDALSTLGAKPDFINNLLSETPPDEFDAKLGAEQILQDQIAIYNQKNPQDFSKHINEAKAVAIKGLKYDVAKAMGVVKPRTEIEQLENKEFVDLIAGNYKDALKNSSTDEKLKAELNDFQQRYIKVVEEFDEFKNVADSQINEAKHQSVEQVRQFKVNQIMDSEFNAVKWGVLEPVKPSLIIGYKAQIANMPWKINEDGTLTAANGVDKAIDFEGKHHFNHISEAIKVLTFPATQKSNGNGAAPTASGAGYTPADDKAKAAVDRLIADIVPRQS